MPHSGAAPIPDAVTGIGWMVASTLISVSTHVVIRNVGTGGMHPLQVAFFYNLFTLPIILPLMLRNGTRVLRTRRYGLLFARAVLHLASMLMFYVGLTLNPLAVAGAMSFLAPLCAVGLAAIFLAEGFSARRWIALAGGIAGTLVIVRPDPATFDANALYLVGAASSWGAVLVIIKVLSRTESSATITVWMTLMMAPMALIPAIPVWTEPAWQDLAWLAGAGLLGAFAQWAISQALRSGATAVVMPFDFLRLVWSALFGYLIFSEVPDLYTWIGGTMIFSATMWLTWRERRAARIVAAAAMRG